MVRLGKEYGGHAAPPEFALDSVAIREGTAEQREEIGHAHTLVAVSGGYRPRPGRARCPPGLSENSRSIHGLRGTVLLARWGQGSGHCAHDRYAADVSQRGTT